MIARTLATVALADVDDDTFQCDNVCIYAIRECKEGEDGCTSDTPSYPSRFGKNMVSEMMLFPDYEYRIKWTGADTRYPVQLQWSFPWSDNHVEAKPDAVLWDHAITTGADSGTYIWTPRAALADFPTALAPNMTGDEALALASAYRWNFLGISQPGKSQDGSQEHGDVRVSWSSAFTLQHPMVEDFLVAQNELGHRDELKKWRLGVGIAVGVGGALMAVGCLLLGYIHGKRSVRRGKVAG